MLLGFAEIGTILGQIIIEAAMKFRTTSRALIAAAFLAALGAASVAQAFTIQGAGGSSGGQGFMDLDKPAAPPDRLGTGSRLEAGQHDLPVRVATLIRSALQHQ
jgi:hypothetical protein